MFPNILINKCFEFRYSTPKKSTLQCDGGEFYCVVNVPNYGLIMGFLVNFGVNKSSEQTILRRIKGESNFHIKVKNVKL